MVVVLDKQRAMEPVRFIQYLHLTGDFYGKPFILQSWQHEVLEAVYGTVNEQGLRQYRYAYLETPKKNGKTELTAAVALYHLVCDGPGGQIYCCAAEREQAALVYKAAKQMVEQDPQLEEMVRVVDSKKEIYNRETGTFIKVLSAEAYSKHGLNPTVVIFDELHAQPNRNLWDVMTFGAGAARREPLWWVITTAGDDPDHKSIGWEIHEYARKVRDGEIVDPAWYVRIYGAPDDANIYDEAVWFASNPSLGVTFDVETVRQEALSARNSEPAEKLFRWLRLNQWVQLKRISWLPLTLWDETTGEWSPSDMLGKKCFIGIDLASKIDLTAAVPLFPPQDGCKEWRFFMETWVPDENMKERVSRDHVPYDQWAKHGYLSTTPGDVVDYDYIKARLEQLAKLYDVRFFCADQWHLEVLRQQFGPEIQRRFIEIPQSIAGQAMGTGELERLFRAKTISHPINPLGRWCFGNAMVAVDGNENKKLMKNKSIERIDPMVALVNAMAGVIKSGYKPNVYELRGMLSLG
jgi:phage terminase large subunit-like protein